MTNVDIVNYCICVLFIHTYIGVVCACVNEELYSNIDWNVKWNGGMKW